MERPFWTIRIPVSGYVTRKVTDAYDEQSAVEQASEEVAELLHGKGLSDVQEDVLGAVRADVVWEPDVSVGDES